MRAGGSCLGPEGQLPRSDRQALHALGPDRGGALRLSCSTRPGAGAPQDETSAVVPGGWWPRGRLTLQFMPRAMELVGRQREQAALRDAIAVAAEADGGILLIAGDAGVGKTALVESALAERSGERRVG